MGSDREQPARRNRHGLLGLGVLVRPALDRLPRGLLGRPRLALGLPGRRHRAGQHAACGALRLPLEAVGGVGHPEAGSVVGAGHRPLALLDDVGELVGQGVLVGTALADDHVLAGGVGASADGGRGRPRGAVVVDADIGEVGVETALHLGARAVVERPSVGSQDVLDL